MPCPRLMVMACIRGVGVRILQVQRAVCWCHKRWFGAFGHLCVRPQIEHGHEFIPHAFHGFQFAEERRPQIREFRLIQLAQKRRTANIQELEKLQCAPAAERLGARRSAGARMIAVTTVMASMALPAAGVMWMCIPHAITTLRIHLYTYVCNLTGPRCSCQCLGTLQRRRSTYIAQVHRAKRKRPGCVTSQPFLRHPAVFVAFPLYPHTGPHQMTSNFENSKGHPRLVRGWPVAQLAPSGLMCPDDDLRSSRPPSCRIYTVLPSVYPGEWCNVNRSRAHGPDMVSCRLGR